MANGLLAGITAPISLLSNEGGEGGGMVAKAPAAATTEEKPTPKKKVKEPYDMAGEIKKHGNTPMVYDNNDTPTNITKRVAQKMGINPSLLFSSAWQEGMNKAALSPDDVSLGYNEAKVGEDYPVDGFLNYGVDTIGDKWDKVKKYLPQGFEQNLKFYKTLNDHKKKVNGKLVDDPQPITTAAFKTNEDALMAKAAMMKYEQDNINDYAKTKGVELDDNAKNYFMLAAYNGGFGNAKEIMDEYLKAKDKPGFIEKGETSLKEIHKNIKSRLNNMAIAEELFNQK